MNNDPPALVGLRDRPHRSAMMALMPMIVAALVDPEMPPPPKRDNIEEPFLGEDRPRLTRGRHNPWAYIDSPSTPRLSQDETDKLVADLRAKRKANFARKNKGSVS